MKAQPEKAEQELVEYVSSVIAELSRIHGGPSPMFKFSFMGNLYLPFRLFGHRKIIIINMKYLDYWRIDKEKAKLCLNYTIAHEFCHYLQDLRGRIPVIKMPSTRPPLGYRLLEYLNLLAYDHEREERIFAEMLSGITSSEHEEILRSLKKKIKSKMVQ